MKRIFKVLIGIFTATLLFHLVSPTKTDAITIFIDGMSSDNTLKGLKHETITPREPYLIKSPLATELKVKDPKQINITWTGDISNIKEWNNSAVEDLKNVIKVLKASPKTKDEPINIVSHSFGTVIAYRALEELQSEKPDIKINSLTTMGSPLGHQPENAVPSITEKIGVQGSNVKEQLAQVLKQALPEPKSLSNVNNWTNLWADYDNISGQIKTEGVKNVQIDSDKAAIEREAQKVMVIPATNAHSTPAAIIEKNPNIKSVDVWHEAYYKGVHIGEINWDIPKDFVAGMSPTLVKGLKEKAVETIETFKAKAKDIIVKSGEKLLKDQTVQDILLTQTGVKVYQHGVVGLLPIPLTKEEAEAQKRLAIKILEAACEAKVPGCFSWDLSMIDASKLSDRNAQQQLTPVKVTFTQTFNGLYTQTPWAPGSQSANFSGSITSGTRTGLLEVRPGNFTGSVSGSLTAYPGDIPGAYNNQPFNAWSVGTVEAKGFKEGPLKGTMNITGTLGGATYEFPKGNVTINTDGSLSHTFNGVIKENGTPWGTANGTLNQTKTTP